MTSPRMLICGFGSFPEAPLNPAAAVIAALAREAWSPPGAEVDFLTLPVLWRGAAETILRQVQQQPVKAVLVVGVAVEARAFRVEQTGRNHAAAARPDQGGRVWGSGQILPGGPATLAATLPQAQIRQAIEACGLPADLSDDAGDYLCNFTLYRLLHARVAEQVGFLHVPQARECAPGALHGLDDIQAAVCAAAETVAAALIRPADEPRRA